jgi:uncharacterized MAPEG superfamily protein
MDRGLSLLLWGCGAAGAVLSWQALVPLMPVDAASSSMAVRLGHGSVALLPGAAALAAMVLVQMLARAVTGRVDPNVGTEPAFLVVNQRCISNTVEQFLVFIPAMLALAAGVPGPRMPEVMALGVVFGLARLLFWAGYLADPVARAPGMVATVTCNAAALFAAAWIWLQA